MGMYNVTKLKTPRMCLLHSSTQYNVIEVINLFSICIPGSWLDDDDDDSRAGSSCADPGWPHTHRDASICLLIDPEIKAPHHFSRYKTFQ